MAACELRLRVSWSDPPIDPPTWTHAPQQTGTTCDLAAHACRHSATARMAQ